MEVGRHTTSPRGSLAPLFRRARNGWTNSRARPRAAPRRPAQVQRDIIDPLKKFAKDSVHLVKKCTKPDRKGASVSHAY